MHWSAVYVGLPWAPRGRGPEGIDCWGLVRLVLGEVRGLDLPSYAEGYVTAGEREEIARLIAGGRAASPWAEIGVGRERPFDVAVFRRAGLDAHVGLVVEPGRMLHVCRGSESRVEAYAHGKWLPRLAGFYRHTGLAGGL